ncbi:hypothetical protein L6452_19097 [Arctium lappa]|uniref:Uncharacterized protein n=1 Tax=Arctium lappa TaxID=4217 RepID=A0ACB9B7Q8_ARCLA|nr:hypothetical protein L6452_19097 [Arctium lappa]
MSIPNTFRLPFETEPSMEENEYEKAHLAIIFDRYKDRLTTFPKEKGWISETLYMYHGFWHLSGGVYSIETMMALQESFKAHPTDIYLVTLPKSGTTWMKALMFALVNRTRYKNNCRLTHPLLIFNPHKCLPFIEPEIYRKTPTYVDAHQPRLFATHIPYTLLPQSILDSGCRLVYMCRNPKDVLVSLFHFTNKLRDKSRGIMTFEEAFEMFSNGVMPYGPHWDHVKGYYNANLEHPTRILFLTYENMEKDTMNNVKRLAEFLGCPFTKKEEAEGAVEEIVKICSFKNLKEVNKHGNLRDDVPNHTFFRKGKVGDWSNHLTTEMSYILDQIVKEKFEGLDISF